MARGIDETSDLSAYVSIVKTQVLHGKGSAGKHTYTHLYICATIKCEFHTAIEGKKMHHIIFLEIFSSMYFCFCSQIL